MGGNAYGAPSDEQQEQFLARIADGETRQEAALAVGSSASRFKGLYKRDEEFAKRYLEALREAGREPSKLLLEVEEAEGVQLVHRMLDEAILRALDPERGRVGASNRVLHTLLLLKAEDFKPLLEARTRHIHEGAVGIYQMPQIDTQKWSIEQHREFVELRKRMAELVALAQPDSGQPPRELPVGDDVIDAEAVEEAEIDEVAV